MPWSDLPETSTFERARRREAYRRFARAVTGQPGQPPLPQLDEVKQRLRLFDQRYSGMQVIEVNKVVGTAGRNADFDKDFLPRRADVRERWRRLEQVYPEGGFPPIAVYRLGDGYWVVDGHHRVAIAKQRKIEFIDAEVTELHVRGKLPDGLDIGRIIFAEQERIFMDESGLSEVRPDARIELSKPDGYVELLELVQVYGYRLSLERVAFVGRSEAALHWYNEVYEPAIQGLREASLHEIFPSATEADLYLLVHQRRRNMFPDRGYLSMQEAAKEVTVAEGRGSRRARRVVKRTKQGEPG